LWSFEKEKHGHLYRNDIYISLLTNKALKGYKKEIVPFKDRKYILEHLWIPEFGYNNIYVVPQNSLNPSENIKKYKPNAIASGDGWEKEESKAIKKHKIRKINITLPKKYSSSAIINKCKKS
jgi:glycerol-3-phosphate cytidylyltransferase-like family protein